MLETKTKLLRDCIALGFKSTEIPALKINNRTYTLGDIDKIPKAEVPIVENYLWNLHLHQEFGRHCN